MNLHKLVQFTYSNGSRWTNQKSTECNNYLKTSKVSKILKVVRIFRGWNISLKFHFFTRVPWNINSHRYLQFTYYDESRGNDYLHKSREFLNERFNRLCELSSNNNHTPQQWFTAWTVARVRLRRWVSTIKFTMFSLASFSSEHFEFHRVRDVSKTAVAQPFIDR